MSEPRSWINLTWREKTWGERGQIVLAWIFAIVGSAMMFLVTLYVLGQIIDTQDQRRAEHRACLLHATNGLEIEQCR